MVLTLVDRLTGFLQLYPITNKTWSKMVVKIQNEWLAKFEIPKIIFADNAFNCKPAKE